MLTTATTTSDRWWCSFYFISTVVLIEWSGVMINMCDQKFLCDTERRHHGSPINIIGAITRKITSANPGPTTIVSGIAIIINIPTKITNTIPNTITTAINIPTTVTIVTAITSIITVTSASKLNLSLELELGSQEQPQRLNSLDARLNGISAIQSPGHYKSEWMRFWERRVRENMLGAWAQRVNHFDWTLRQQGRSIVTCSTTTIIRMDWSEKNGIDEK